MYVVSATGKVIKVYSDLTGFDFIIDVYGGGIETARKITEKAYYDWFESDTCETLYEYIGNALTAENIDYEFYYPEGKEI